MGNPELGLVKNHIWRSLERHERASAGITRQSHKTLHLPTRGKLLQLRSEEENWAKRIRDEYGIPAHEDPTKHIKEIDETDLPPGMHDVVSHHLKIAAAQEKILESLQGDSAEIAQKGKVITNLIIHRRRAIRSINAEFDLPRGYGE